MVAPDRAGEHRAGGGEEDAVEGAVGEAGAPRQRHGQRDHERDQDRHRRPGCSGGEGHRAGGDEDHRREEEEREVAAQQLRDVRGGAHVLGDRAQRPGQNQDHHRDQHRLDAAEPRVHALLHVEQALAERQRRRHQAAREGSPQERHEGVRRAEDVPERGVRAHRCAPRGVEPGEDDHDHRQHRDPRVPPPLRHVLPRIHEALGDLGGRPRPRAQDASARRGPGLGAGHGTEVAVHERSEEDEREREQRIEEVGDGLQEDGVGAEPGQERLVRPGGLGGRRRVEPPSDQGHLVAHPGRDRDQRRDRRGRRVHQVGELLARHLQPVGDGAHRVPDHQRVRVVVEEDREARQPGGDLAAPAVAGQRRHRPHHPARPAVAADDSDHPAQQQAEDHDLGVASVHVAERHDHVLVDEPPRGQERVVARHRERAQPDSGQQGGDHLLEEKREDDRDQRRQQREPSRRERARDLDDLVARVHAQGQGVPRVDGEVPELAGLPRSHRPGGEQGALRVADLDRGGRLGRAVHGDREGHRREDHLRRLDALLGADGRRCGEKEERDEQGAGAGRWSEHGYSVLGGRRGPTGIPSARIRPT